jgi:hypothetical protein
VMGVKIAYKNYRGSSIILMMKLCVSVFMVVQDYCCTHIETHKFQTLGVIYGLY